MPTDSKASPTADVIIVGGGLIGCAIAFRLAQARLRVYVLERGEPGAEASGAAAGMVAPQGETVEPGPFFDLCSASRDLYASFLTEIEELSGESIEYRRDGTLLVAVEDSECRELERIHRAQTRMGLPLEVLTPELIHQRIKGLAPGIRHGLFVPGDHWLDNEQLIQALVKACRRLGVTFCAGSPVRKVSVRNGRVDSVEVRSPQGGLATFFAGEIVLAAGSWSRELVEPLGISLPMEPCRGQLLEFDAPDELPFVVRSGIHYLVPRTGRRILVGTTAEYVGFEKAVTGEGLRFILEGALRIAPLAKNLRLRRTWAGLRPDTADHLPILGYGGIENLVFATGHFRNGILLAPVTGKLISELVLTGCTSHPIEAYSPTRFA